MEHPSKENLEKYASRQLSAGEMTLIILHLEDCPECFDTIHRLSFSAENESAALFSETETETFHLDYDEHLRPFVDLEADAATREIVESHTQTCSTCAFELRELREFSESLRLREIERQPKVVPGFFAKINEIFHNLSHNLTLKTVLPILLICIVVGAIIWFSIDLTENNGKQANIEEIQKSEVQTGQIQINPVENLPQITEQVNQNVANRQLPNEKPQPEKIQAPEDNILAEIKTLPDDLRVSAQKALQTKKLVFPGFLAAIREDINLRGNAPESSNSIYPKGEAVRDAAPKFRWTRFAEEGEKYVVEIFDEKDNSIAVSPALSEANWKPKIALPRGKTYSWEVRAEKANAQRSTSFAGKFRVLEGAEIAKLNNTLSKKSPLLRGIVFASRGLLTEAEIEFNQAIKTRENPEPARTLLLQIKNQR